MLMRISGGTEGIREYLETGRKADREWSRDELDTRLPLAGDLDFTDQVIGSMQGKGEKYLHITLSFREDEISRETLEAITEDFRDFAFAAYDADEYVFYAEAHLPRRTSYTHAQTGALIERKPHIHIVVPETNLLTGRSLNPFGRVEHQTAFLEAFQEHVNAKYGLASPKDHQRAELTPASELISRYKGDVFRGAGADVKAEILDAILDRDVRTMEGFDALLRERGEVRSRNAGKAGEYRNLKRPDDAKGINLKGYVFSREFIELSAIEKRAKLTREAAAHYATAQEKRPTQADYAAKLDDWRERRALEIKYLNSGNRKAYQAYREADPVQQRAMLAQRREAFYQRHRAGIEPPEPQRPAPNPATQKAIMRAAYAEALAEKPEAGTLGGLRTLGDVGVLSLAAAPDPLPLPAPADRQPNSVIERFTDELHEQRAQGAERGDMDRIKRELDGRALLDRLSHSHGVIPEKYAVTQGKDGGDRIRCGSRNLNVSDFLTKELHLPWKEASAILRECHDRQVGGHKIERHEPPRQKLWSRFQDARPDIKVMREKAWGEQLAGEKKRRDRIRSTYQARRGKAQGDRTMRPAERKAAVSIARMERIAAEQALREAIKREREQLKAEFPYPPAQQYGVWLRRQAEAGDRDALDELRRREGVTWQHQEKDPSPALRSDHINPATPFLPFRYEVSRTGDVTYSDRQGHLLRDARDRVSMLRTDDQAIAIGLKLAQQKFYKGGALTEITVANGTPEFRRQAVEVAVREGIRVSFADKDMERYRVELIAKQQAAKVEARGQGKPQPQPQPQQQPDAKKEQKPATPRRPRGVER